MKNASSLLPRIALVGAVSLIWGMMTFALQHLCEPLLAGFCRLVTFGIGILGIPCVSDGSVIFLEKTSRTLDLGDTGIYWWGIIAAVCLSSKLTLQTKVVRLCLSWVICTAIHAVYYASSTIVQTANMAKMDALLSCAWYASLFILVSYLLSEMSQEPSVKNSVQPGGNSEQAPAAS